MKDDPQGVRKVERLLGDLDSIQKLFVRRTMSQLIYELLKIANLLTILRRPSKPSEAEYARHIAHFFKVVQDVERKLKISQPALLWPFLKRSFDTATLQTEDEEVCWIEQTLFYLTKLRLIDRNQVLSKSCPCGLAEVLSLTM